MILKKFEQSYFFKKFNTIFRKERSVSLESKIQQEDISMVMGYIENSISQKTGEDIIVYDNKLEFKSNFFTFRSNYNIMQTIERGQFKIIEDENESILVYIFSLRRFNIMIMIPLIFTMVFAGNPSLVEIIVYSIIVLLATLFIWYDSINRNIKMLHKIADGINKFVKKNNDNILIPSYS